jgi:thioredoxin 1
MNKINTDNFEKIINDEKGLFVIKFYSPTCGPCKTMTPVFEALDKNNNDINVYEVDTMESPELASHFGVRGVPYVTYCEGREVLYSFTGVTPLGNLQYVIDNIDDSYFREHGDFEKQDEKKDHRFTLLVFFLIVLFVSLITFL